MIRSHLLAALLAALLPALAAAAPAAGPASRVPRPPKNEAKAKAEIQEMYLGFIDAGERGDAEAAAALIDFPLVVASDGAKGEGLGASWTRERWLATLAPSYDAPDKDAKVSRKAIVFVVSDVLATVNLTTTTEKAGKKKVERSGAIVVRNADEWRIKALVESGWLDVATPPVEPDETAEAAPRGEKGPAASAGAAAKGAPAEKEDAEEPKDPPAKDEAR
jgi:hypothetical protein